MAPGFNSSGRFYETSNELLGMTPKAFRDGGVNTEIRFAVGECSLGSILVAMTGKGVCAILFGDDPDALVRELQDRFPKATLIGGDKAFEKIVAKVVGFVEAPAKGLDLPLDIRGTAFQQRVWQALRKIPAGKTATLCRYRQAHRFAQRGARGRHRLRRQSDRRRHSVPPRGAQQWRTRRLLLGCRAEDEVAGSRGKKEIARHARDKRGHDESAFNHAGCAASTG